MTKALLCDVCGAPAPLLDCDGWLTLSRIDIDPNDPSDLASLMATVVRLPINQDTGQPEVPKRSLPPLTADPMRIANVEVCSTECGIRFLEERRIWEAAVAAEAADADDPP